MSDAQPNNLRALRTAAGLSQREVADAISTRTDGRTPVTAGNYSRWERGSVIPTPYYRRLLADVFAVEVQDLGIVDRTASAVPPGAGRAPGPLDDLDPRVLASHDRWRTTRARLNATRHALAQLAAGLYGDAQLARTGLITSPAWLPDRPVDLADVDLATVPLPAALDGTEPETALVRPMQSLVRPYGRYTQAIRDLARPRLFENRMCWRLTDVNWPAGRLGFDDATYFAGVDVFEATAHELAYVALDDTGALRPSPPVMRDLPYRRRIGNPFDLSRRPTLVAVSTLTIRRGDVPEFLLHRRDARSVTAAGGMLQVIPSGIFQPSSILPGARAADFNLWRNVMREFSEELLGNPEHDGDGLPVDYTAEPFGGLDAARRAGRLQVYALGLALDSLTLVGELLTVAVLDGDVFDELAADFVERNDEGAVVGQRWPFTEPAIRELLDGGLVAPAGAGCIELAWRWRSHIGL